ncbi:MAG: hypothetical protein REH83_01140 [Rickettsiella sp.]|nr:hypothetical protein [Rickettsiella sp.]
MFDITKPNPFLDEEEYKKLNPLEETTGFAVKKKKTVEIEEDDDGGESTSGSIALNIEQLDTYLLACFTKERRYWQKKFGLVPYTDDPNSLLGKKLHTGSLCGELPHAHPLLALSQQFSGDDKKLTANPVDNANARERYLELRNENQLRKNPELGRRKSVTLSR